MTPRILSIITLGIALTLSAHGATNSWIDGNSKWENTNNWSLGMAPSINDSADLITNAGSNTVTIDATTSGNSPSTMTISNLLVSANRLLMFSAGTNVPLHILNLLTLTNGATMVVTNSAFQTDGVSVGSASSAEISDSSLKVQAGSSVLFNGLGADFGVYAGDQATLTVEGGTINVQSQLSIGTRGAGTLWVANGSLVSDNLYLGLAGAGSATISNGNVIVGYQLLLGNNAGSRGALTILGGSVSVYNFMEIGNLFGAQPGTVLLRGGALYVTNATGTAQLNLNNGTLVLSNGATLVADTYTNLSATFTNVGGTFTLRGPATVDQGTATFSGGTSQFGATFAVGSSASSTGTVNVTGGTLVVTNSAVNIGNDGTVGGTGGVARVTVSGGLVQAASISVGDNFASASSFTISSNGHVVVQGGLRVNGNHTTTVTDSGTLDVLVGPPPLFEDPVLNNRIVVADGADGTMLVSNGTVNAPEMVIGFSAGNTGTLAMNGGIVSLSSNLWIGMNASVTGLVTISGGTLTVTNGTFGIGNSGTVGGVGGVGKVAVSAGLVQAASILVGDNFNSASSFAVAGSGHVVVQGGLRVNGNHTTTVNGGTLEVLVGPTPVFEDPFLRNRIVVAYGADGTVLVSNGTLRAPELLLGGGVGNTGSLALSGGSISVFSNMTVGFVGCASTGLVNMTGGSLYVTNGGTAVLEIRSGTFTLSAGTVVVDKLVITNACARLVRTGGTLIYSQLVLDPNLSAVGDGIPNGWKQQYGLDPFNPAVANADADGDGMSNLQEYLAGTDPTNSASAFRITSVTRTGSNVAVTWNMGSGKTNALQFANSASYMTNFTDLFIVTNTVGTVTNYLDVGGATNVPSHYYRVRLVP